MPDLLGRLQAALADRYAVKSEIGRGGMATVFLAQDLKHRRQVAIKVLHPELAATLGTDRFLREIEIAAGLNHPHILPLFDSGEAAGLVFYVMPYVQGESLQERLETEVQLPIDEAVGIAAEVAEGLDYAHRQGVIHRDIKPGNILLSEGHALIADFGIARAIGAASDGEAAATGLAVGTPNYMSPEQATADANVDGRSDIYALGCVLWETLAGEPPFGGPTPQVIMARKAVEEAPDVRGIRGRVPEALEACLEGAVAPSPADRFSTAAEFASALRDAVLLGVTPQAVARRKRKRRRRWVLASVAVVVAAGGLFAWRTHLARQEIRWARTEAMPEIRRLASENKYDSAIHVATLFESILPNDTTLDVPWMMIARNLTIRTDPPGARVFYWTLWEDADTARQFLGTTPIEGVPLPHFSTHFRFEKDGYEPRDVIKPPWGDTRDLTRVVLDTVGSLPSGMVRVSGWSEDLGYTFPDTFGVTDYYLDRFEVTNRQYKEFVDAGGYETPDYWREPFVVDGVTVSREEARELLIDRTGRPGPSTWEDGSYPEGKGDDPAGGLSWYEAAAYARFAGKSLPSSWHSIWALDEALRSEVIPWSNLEGEGPVAVGTLRGMGTYGALDQYGNVREWAYNAMGGERFIHGGSWSDVDHRWMEWKWRSLSPWDRSPENGLRLALYMDTVGISSAQKPVPVPVAPEYPERDYRLESPVDAAEYERLARSYDYESAALDPVVELADTVYGWPLERISFTGPDSTRTMGAYLFLPRSGRPPYQTVLYFTGYVASFRNFAAEYAAMFDPILRAGRAVAVPILYGTFEPFDPEKGLFEHVLYQPPEIVVQWVKEVRRAVDYLVSRPDLETHAPVVLALEPRIKAALTESGTLLDDLPVEPRHIDPFHFLPRVRTPITIIHSHYSEWFPFESTQQPMLDHLGTSEEHKRLLSGPYSDPVPLYNIFPHVNPWFDEYLGPVEGF